MAAVYMYKRVGVCVCVCVCVGGGADILYSSCYYQSCELCTSTSGIDDICTK